MPYDIDFFRDYGISPDRLPTAPELVRAHFSKGRIFGQYLGTAIMSGFGLAMALLAIVAAPFPLSLAFALLPVALFGGIVVFATRNDYAWIELDGDTLRARHLYTGKVVERQIYEIDDLLTHVFQVRTLTTMLVDQWLGRIRGIEVRFVDRKTPLRVSRVDPAMENGKELIEAVISRMAEIAPVDAEIAELRGEPIIRRIHWKPGPAREV